ncbi:hypothetical protein [Streptomyces sp. MMBL 11-1]|uniref:hypothetical protein n=1 Tax=Streptomyces sp. MMBL 11-1 TaxID=3026420 RepID=UPI00235FB5B8|nr:hypothetical protein [Streptomyces sp. MMBL 11-1]
MSSEEGMSWPEAEARLMAVPGLEVSSLEWTQPGKYVFWGAVKVQLPDGTEAETEPGIWFKDAKNRVYPWAPSWAGRNRCDWVEGRSLGVG